MGAAYLLVALGTEAGDDQIAFLGGEEEAVAILREKNIRGSNVLTAVRRRRGSDAFSSGRLDAAKLAVARRAVDVSSLHERRGEDAVETRLAVAFPRDRGAGL